MQPPTFTSRPWYSALGNLASIVGLIGLPLSIWLYWLSLSSRDLTLYVDPATVEIVKADQSSKLAITYNGQPVKGAVTAVQVCLWNAGKLPIEPADVLKPVVIATEGNVPILEATISGISRDVVGTTLDTSEATKGRVKVSWTIFEQDDGVRLQLICAGGPGVKAKVEGAFKGQKEVRTSPGTPRVWGWIISCLLAFCLIQWLIFQALNVLSNRPSFLTRRLGPISPTLTTVLQILIGGAFGGAMALLLLGKVFSWINPVARLSPPPTLLSPNATSVAASTKP